MIALLCFFLTLFASPFKSKSRASVVTRPDSSPDTYGGNA
jgi:hypothetical protein